MRVGEYKGRAVASHGGEVFAIARRLGLPVQELCDFSASINPLGPPPGVAPAIAAAVALLGHYPDREAPELLAALADWHGLAVEQVCVGNGSTELIHLLPRLVPGRRALVFAPPFAEYATALQQQGWQVDYLDLRPEDDFALPLEGLTRQVAGYDLVVLGNPGNPSGRLYPTAEVAMLLAACRAAGAFLVVDEAFMDFCEEASGKGLLVQEPAALVLRSLTKFFALPGLRLGCALGHPATIAALRRLVPPWSVNTLAQAAGVAALADREHAAATLATVTAARLEMVAALAALPAVAVFPAAANYLLLRLPEGCSARSLAERLQAQRLLVRPCGDFHGLSDRFLRVAVRLPAENARLLAALSPLLTIL